MFGLGSSRENEKLIAVADVGGGGAGVALVLLHPHRSPTVLASKILTLPVAERMPAQEIAGVLSLLVQTCEETIKVYAASHGNKRLAAVSGAYAVIHAPWVRSKTLRADAGFESEERITEKVLGELIRKAVGTEERPDVPALLRSGSVQVDLNGYPTRRPLGKSAHAVEVSVLVSECESAVRTGAVEALQRSFSVVPTLRSRERALVSLLGVSAQDRDQTVVGMSAAGTDVIVVRHNEAVDRAVVAEGSRTILARVSTGGLSEEALSLMNMIAHDACTSEACTALQTALVRIEPELVRIFGETMANLAAARRLPNAMTILAEPEFAPWLARFFSRLDFGQFTVTTRPFSVSVPPAADFENLLATEPGSGVNVDLALAVHCATMEEQDE